MGRSSKYIELARTSLRMEKEHLDKIKECGLGQYGDGQHIFNSTLFTYVDLPDLTEKEAWFIIAALNSSVIDNPQSLAWCLIDTYEDNPQDANFNLDKDTWFKKIKLFSKPECYAVINAANAYWAMTMVMDHVEPRQFFKVS
ncbi:MAG: hypothetical protein HRT88_00155 [Lentisphaeraceae bacterium]|nr:hypothetical protein [Lentisphaeraceae bacterium]